MKFIDKTTHDLKTHLTKNQNKFWNNLSDEQRKAIVDLGNDDSIIIKPTDKGSSVIKFLQILSNWSSCRWVLLSLIFLSSSLQSIPSSSSFQSHYAAVCKLSAFFAVVEMLGEFACLGLYFYI